MWEVLVANDFLTRFESSCGSAASPPAHRWTCGPGRGNASSSSEMAIHRELKAVKTQKPGTSVSVQLYRPHIRATWLLQNSKTGFVYFTLQLLRSWPSFIPWRPSQKQRKLPGVFRHSSAHTLASHSSTSDKWQSRVVRDWSEGEVAFESYRESQCLIRGCELSVP